MLKLTPLNASEFEAYTKVAIPKYAAEKARGEGYSESESRRIAEESFQKLLPAGLETPGHSLFSVLQIASGRAVGILWLARVKTGDTERAYVYDIIIDEAERGKGFGQKTMELAEVEARRWGVKAIGLHVFGHNHVAQSLYEKLGYLTTNRLMAKSL